MMDDTQFTAFQALSRFLEIYNGPTPEQLQTPVVTEAWRNGEQAQSSSNASRFFYLNFMMQEN